MYHYFKGVSESAPNKVIVDLKSEMARKTSTVSQVLSMPQSPTLLTISGATGTNSSSGKKQPEYMEMHCNSGSSCGSGDQEPYGPVNGVTNLNYINVEDDNVSLPEPSVDVCDGAQFTEPETTNELKINEPAYYESKDSNKADTFSEECSNLLDNVADDVLDSLPLPPPPPAPVEQQTPLSEMTEQQLQRHQADLMADYLIQPSNRPVTMDDGLGDYLTHPSNKPIHDQSAMATSLYMNDDVDGSHMKMSFGKKKKKTDHLNCSLDTVDTMNTSSSSSVRTHTLKRQESETSKASVDDELLEIINDFKNNVFTINEVEQLVSTWKNRNDVQQSFKDKELQLQKMRHEYDRLQTQMKDRMKRPTPFERVRKLFSRNKTSEDKDNTTVTGGALMEVSQDKLNASGQRPPSSLSLHSVTSSTSSGRLSTGSVCSGTSLGDSGTHSDHDERRPGNFTATNCRVGTPGSLLLDNYMVPPAPRPVSSAVASPSAEECRFGNPSEHYIIFPSNAPVYPQHDYINFGGASASSGLNTIDENKEADLHSVQTIKIQKPKDLIYAPVLRKGNPCSSFRNLSPRANVGGDSLVLFTKADSDLSLKEYAEEVMMRNQMQNSVKVIKDQKMLTRQHSSDTNNEPLDDHSYMNLTV